jgi:RHS repeat-associated protein
LTNCRRRGVGKFHCAFLTQKERDSESGLDYFLARYYSSAQGRFASVDPYNVIIEAQSAIDKKGAEKQFITYLSNPQRWNRYSYALDNPMFYTDPKGEDVTIYYRPPDPNGSSYRDQGHILIYVRNDETGESAYFDYYPDVDAQNNPVTALGNVNQERIDAHHSLTIQTTAAQEQTVLAGISALQQSAPNFDAPDPLHGHNALGGESTCVSTSTNLLSLAGINLDSRTPKGLWDEAFKEYGDSRMGKTLVLPSTGGLTLKNSDPPYPPAPGREYGHDPRGQARVLDQNARNNQKLFFRDGKRVN